MIKAILFDNFGVIASVEYWSDVEDQELKNGNESTLAGLIDNMNLGKINWQKFCAGVAQDLGISEQEVEKRYSKYSLNRRVIAIAEGLKKRYIVGIASNAHHEYLEPVLEETGLDMLFDPIFISSMIGFTKPDPAFYVHVLGVLNLKPEECLLIDDSQINIAGAEAVGMKGLLFESAVQLEGDLQSYL